VLLKTFRQFGLEASDLAGELDDHGHHGSGRGAHGIGDDRGGFELGASQHLLNLDGPFLDAALTTRSPQGRGDLGLRQPTAQRRRGGDRQDRQGVGRAELIERSEGRLHTIP
jgi:hypothetical protein